MSKLWLLKAREDLPDDREKNPWIPWYDKMDGFVIRAETEEEARKIAQEKGGDEAGRHFIKPPNIIPAWTSSEFSTCVELTPEGDIGVILDSFNAG